MILNDIQNQIKQNQIEAEAKKVDEEVKRNKKKDDELLYLIKINSLYQKLLPIQDGIVDFEYTTHSSDCEGCMSYHHRRTCTVHLQLKKNWWHTPSLIISYHTWYSLFAYHKIEVYQDYNTALLCLRIDNESSRSKITPEHAYEIIIKELAKHKFKPVRMYPAGM